MIRSSKTRKTAGVHHELTRLTTRGHLDRVLAEKTTLEFPMLKAHIRVVFQFGPEPAAYERLQDQHHALVSQYDSAVQPGYDDYIQR